MPCHIDNVTRRSNRILYSPVAPGRRRPSTTNSALPVPSIAESLSSTGYIVTQDDENRTHESGPSSSQTPSMKAAAIAALGHHKALASSDLNIGGCYGNIFHAYSPLFISSPVSWPHLSPNMELADKSPLVSTPQTGPQSICVPAISLKSFALFIFFLRKVDYGSEGSFRTI